MEFLYHTSLTIIEWYLMQLRWTSSSKARHKTLAGKMHYVVGTKQLEERKFLYAH